MQTQRNPIYTEVYQLLLDGYDNMVRAIGYKAAENGSMQNKVREFLCYLERQNIHSIKRVKPTDMVSYYEYLSQRPNIRRGGVLSSSSISEHMGAIELFNEYLLNKGILVKQISLPKNLNRSTIHRNILTTAEVTQIYSTVENKRDKALLNLAYGCGMRRTEIEDLNIIDVQLTKGMVIVREGKNRKRREIPLPDSIIRDLKDYLINERHKYLKPESQHRIESFLVSSRGKSMSGSQMNRRIKDLILKTKNPELESKAITLHCLRHSIATHLLDAGASIEFVRDFLGHAEIDTVHIYARRRLMREKQINRLNR